MRRSSAAGSLLVLGALLLAACGDDDQSGDSTGPDGPAPPTEQVTLSVENERVVPGGRIAVRVVNDSEFTATGGVCPVLERREEGDEWKPVGARRACIQIAEVIEPGERSGEHVVRVPASVEGTSAGLEYRVHHEVNLDVPGPDVEPVDLTAPVTIVSLRDAVDDRPEGPPSDGGDRTDPELGVELVIMGARASKPPTVTAGAAVRVRVHNGTDERITYGACPALERRDGADWVTVPSEPTACIQIAYSTAPGQTGGGLGVEVPPDAKPGGYRIRHQVTTEDREAPTVIAPLQVTSP